MKSNLRADFPVGVCAKTLFFHEMNSSTYELLYKLTQTLKSNIHSIIIHNVGSRSTSSHNIAFPCVSGVIVKWRISMKHVHSSLKRQATCYVLMLHLTEKNKQCNDDNWEPWNRFNSGCVGLVLISILKSSRPLKLPVHSYQYVNFQQIYTSLRSLCKNINSFEQPWIADSFAKECNKWKSSLSSFYPF